MPEKFYITTAIPYVNAKPHIGHALEFVQTDAIARYQKLLGKDTLLLSGADENALKNVQAAEAAGMDVQEFVDLHAKHFQELADSLAVRLDVFQKGSNRETHYPSAQKLWELCKDDIYKQAYTGLYCLGCEAFYTPEELNEKGECYEHPGKKLEEVSEENYFFKLSKYQQQLIDLIESDRLKILPKTRKNEVLSFLKEPLQDVSVSRSNERAKNWGVPVPGDESQRIYVWFDALNIYQSGIGFGWDEKQYKKWWPADCHVIGKGIIRFHAVYWPAFLMSAGLELPKALFIHGYITAEGQKMSKTLGNVIDPFDLVDEYGAEGVRYYLLSQIPSYNDGDFSRERFEDIYNAHLAGGLGNLVARVTSMTDKYFDGKAPQPTHDDPFATGEVWQQYQEAFDRYQIDEAVDVVWQLITKANQYIEENKPWELAKSDPQRLGRVMYDLLEVIRHLGALIFPILPISSQKIADILGYTYESLEQEAVWGRLPKDAIIKKGAILFPRLDKE